MRIATQRRMISMRAKNGACSPKKRYDQRMLRTSWTANIVIATCTFF